MNSGKVLTLYMSTPDLMRAGHRVTCDEFDCDANGIVGDINYEKDVGYVALLVSQKSYEIIEQAEIVVDKGILMESIYVDIDLNHLKKGSVIEIGDNLFEVSGPCQSYRYLYAIAPELPELIDGNRGIFVTPLDYSTVRVGDEVKVIQEA